MEHGGLGRTIRDNLLIAVVTLPITIIGGLILAYFLQDARFAPDNNPTPVATTPVTFLPKPSPLFLQQKQLIHQP